MDFVGRLKRPRLRQTIEARVYRGESTFVGECQDIAVVTQGSTIEEACENLSEAIGLYFDDEDPVALGFSEKALAVICTSKRPVRIDDHSQPEGIDFVESLTQRGFRSENQWGHLKFVRETDGRKEIVVLTQDGEIDTRAKMSIWRKVARFL